MRLPHDYSAAIPIALPPQTSNRLATIRDRKQYRDLSQWTIAAVAKQQDMFFKEAKQKQ